MAVSTLGYNYDVLSYVSVARVVEDGKNIYAETSRYNYAPPWSYVVHRLAVWATYFPNPFAAFRWELTILLTIVDICIAVLLFERYGMLASLLFFLNPVTVFITGYHRQFDNTAVLVGLLAAGFAERDDTRSRVPLVTLTVGFSLAVKHVLFAFPLWLAAKERTFRDRLLMLLVPPGLFALTFLPFLADGAAGIVKNVFLYRGYDNAPLWRFLFPPSVLGVVSPTLLFLATLTVAGILLRRRRQIESLLIYLVLLVIASPAIANQALTLPAVTMAVFPNVAFGLFVAVALVHLLIHHEGLHLESVKALVPASAVGYTVQVILLLSGLVWVLCGKRLKEMGARAGRHYFASGTT